MFTKIGGSYIPNKNATQTILQTLSEKNHDPRANFKDNFLRTYSGKHTKRTRA